MKLLDRLVQIASSVLPLLPLSSLIYFVSLAFLIGTVPAAVAQTLLASEADFLTDDFQLAELIQLDELPLAADILDEFRGGFTIPGNVTIDIGFENMVLIDGVLQAQTRFTLDGLLTGSANAATVQSALTPIASTVLSSDVASSNGLAVTRIAIGELGLPLQTLIQNNQDNRTIQSLQVLNIEFGNMGNGFFGPLHQLMNLQAIESVR